MAHGVEITGPGTVPNLETQRAPKIRQEPSMRRRRRAYRNRRYQVTNGSSAPRRRFHPTRSVKPASRHLFDAAECQNRGRMWSFSPAC
jgi:hypothetical protein